MSLSTYVLNPSKLQFNLQLPIHHFVFLVYQVAAVELE